MCVCMRVCMHACVCVHNYECCVCVHMHGSYDNFCRFFSGLIVGCLQGADKDTLLSPHFCPMECDYWKENPMVRLSASGSVATPSHRTLCALVTLFVQVPEVDAIAAGSYKHLSPPDIMAKGYVVRSLEAVLWAFYHTQTFEEGCLKVGKSTARCTAIV